MSPRKHIFKRQPYPRATDDLLADIALFPKQQPSLTEAQMREAVRGAFFRVLQNKRGESRQVPSDPQALVKRTIRHIQERSDPVLTPYFYSQIEAKKIFLLDATSHEMQVLRMKIGVFYQFLLIELMRRSTSVIQASDGTREGDVVADIKAPVISSGSLRLYISVKKSVDTVGGQDLKDAIRRLEDIALLDKNLNSPYLCVLFHANPVPGKSRSYESDRTSRKDAHGVPFSFNAEFWGPVFMFSYITGHEPVKIYTLCREEISNYLPVQSLMHLSECTRLLTTELEKHGIIHSNKKIDPQKFYEFIAYSKHTRATKAKNPEGF